jgi:uncharacterized protein YbaR (Trm112 family)
MTTNHTLHTATLKNNCPECFANNGLQFTFSQKETTHKLYVKAEKNIEEKLYCNSCGNDIYPVNWDDDIERVYNYNKKQVQPLNSRSKLTKLGVGLMALTAILISTGSYFVIKYVVL